MTNSRLSNRKMEGAKVMKSKGIDGAALRIIAMLTLLIDHIGWFFLKDLLPDRHDRRPLLTPRRFLTFLPSCDIINIDKLFRLRDFTSSLRPGQKTDP